MVTYSPGILPRPSRSATASRCRQSSGPTRTRLTGRPEDSLSCTARHSGASSADSSDTGFTVVQHKHLPINPETPNPGLSPTWLASPSGGLRCILEPWLRLDFEVAVVGVDSHEEVIQEA